jgi:hypothetical protein
MARIGERRGACSVLVGKIEGKKTLGKSGADGRIILKWIFNK